MKTFTLDDIRGWRPAPCYDPGRWLPEGWSGTALDVLKSTKMPPKYKLWCVLRRELLVEGTLLDKKTIKRFSRWCARRANTLKCSNEWCARASACAAWRAITPHDGGETAQTAAWVWAIVESSKHEMLDEWRAHVEELIFWIE